ncbi:hypothetical protein QBC42DRAFT_181025 [Cladorrhinum samala]|uniref:Uncharacterized protein n=1 Tax=Cladorrhinum samala TaxID=585594 RepID=A0AAV9HIH2_9PEZI|nr:hypothetical protein QBC42DRAFT_181025 [Cladorrhinum samala]
MVAATLHFISPLDRYRTEKPYFLNVVADDPSQTILQTNLEYTPRHGIALSDIRERGLEAFSLENNGFAILKYPKYQTASDLDPAEGDGAPSSAIESFCDDMVKLVMRECNAVHGICYDYRIRRNDSRDVSDYERDQDQGRTAAAPPVFPVHIDHTVEGGPKRIRRHLTEQEAETYLNKDFRTRIINVWRPLNRPVEDCPITLCDPRSVNAQCDLVAADRVTPDFAVELYYLKHNPNQKWYWLPRQAPDELLVFVNYDSNCRLDGTQWGSKCF